ncbi:ATP-binding protein [Phragmitibacter flavus]|nr:ATP-binding protein [Phragmitibacter flavus]
MLPSLSAEKFIEDVHSRVGAKTKAVLGRAAVSLALGESIPAEYKPPAGTGKDISWDALVGPLEDVFRVAIRSRAGKALDEPAFQREFRRAFEFGCMRMEQIWEFSGRDQARFVAELMRSTQHPGGTTPSPGLTSSRSTSTAIDQEVILQLLTDGQSWSINGEKTPNGLLIISGQSGRGKSQLALDLLAQLSRQGVRFLFFDLKGELEEADDDAQKAESRRKFLELTGARYLRLIDSNLPVNPLYPGKNKADTANIASRVAALVRAFGPQMGPNQETAIRDAYQQLKHPDFTSLVEQLKKNGQEGVAVSVLSKVVELNIFSRATSAERFEDWISHSNIIDLKRLDNETRVLVVAFILNFFIERLNKNLSVRNGIQPIQMVLFVDEAHNILPKDGKARLLEKLAREGRSWGFPLWLASQDADKFVSSDADFSEFASAGIHFSPQTLSTKEQKQILGGVVTQSLEKGEAVMCLGGKTTTGAARQFWREGGK